MEQQQQQQAPLSPPDGGHNTNAANNTSSSSSFSRNQGGNLSPPSPTGGASGVNRRTRLTEKMSRMHKRRGVVGSSTGNTTTAAASPSSKSVGGAASPTAAAGASGSGLNVSTTTSATSSADIILSSQSVSPSMSSGSNKGTARPRRFARKLSDLSSSRENHAAVGVTSSGSNTSSSIVLSSSRGSNKNEGATNKEAAAESKVASSPRPFGPMSSMNKSRQQQQQSPSSPKSAVSGEEEAAGAGLSVATGNAAGGDAGDDDDDDALSPLQDVVPKKSDSLTSPRVDAILTEVSSCTSGDRNDLSPYPSHAASLSEVESHSEDDDDSEHSDDDDESHDLDDDETYDDDEETHDESTTRFSPQSIDGSSTPPRRITGKKSKKQQSPHRSPTGSNNNMDMIRNALAPPSLMNVSMASASTAGMHNHSTGQQHNNNTSQLYDSSMSQSHSNAPLDLSMSSTGGGGSALSPTSTTTTAGNNGGTPDRKGRIHNRVPGGAAAKLILLRPQNSDEDRNSKEEGDDDDVLGACAAGADEKEQDVSDINISMTKAKTEFAVGSESNRRYYKFNRDGEDGESKGPYGNGPGGGDQDDTASLAPSIFNRSEVFHQTAAAAVAALLTPRHLASSYGGHGGVSSVIGGQNGDAVSVLSVPQTLNDVPSTMSIGQASVATSAFQTPKEPGQESLQYESLARRAVSPHLISQKVESRLNHMTDMMHDPNKTLADLLTAINSPEDGGHVGSSSNVGSQEAEGVGPGENQDDGDFNGSYESDDVNQDDDDEKRQRDNMDIGYLVRRKNACGALQVLTAPIKNRVKIAWTLGVLPALTSVLRDTGDEGVTVTFPDKRRRREFEAARNRAVACLMNLSMPKENRVVVFHTPHLAHWLVIIIMEGQAFPRKGCCAILAFLSKSVENRLLMVQVPGLIDAATKVIKPRPPRVETVDQGSQSGLEEKDEDDDDASDVSHDDGVSNKPSALSDQHSRLISVGSSFSNESDDTPRLGGGNSPVEISGYDETADELLRGARQNIFAMLGHLVKEKDNAYHLVRHSNLIAALSEITGFQSSPSHILAVQMLACLSRHRLNTKVMVFKHRMVVPALVQATQSVTDETRMYACFALQNLAQDKSCRQELAVSPGLVTSLCDRSREATATAERLAAISALKNLCDEPANLIPMTNTPDCIATLMHLAHGKEPGIDETMQYRACDALATLSHWLRKIATSGQSMETAKMATPNASNATARRELRVPKGQSIFVPSLRVVTWNQWE